MPYEKARIPAPDDEFDEWFKNLCVYTIERAQGARKEWFHIPDDALTELITRYADWFTAYIVTTKPVCQIKGQEEAWVQAKDEARAAAEAVILPFVGEYLRDGAIPLDDLLELGVHVPTPWTPDAKPDGYPGAYGRGAGPGTVTITFEPSGWFKTWPEGVIGAEIRWDIREDSERPSLDKETYTNSVFAESSPVTLTFDESQRGKVLYFYIRWESRTHVKGDSTGIWSAHIP
jgi:hypothetical protein